MILNFLGIGERLSPSKKNTRKNGNAVQSIKPHHE